MMSCLTHTRGCRRRHPSPPAWRSARRLLPPVLTVRAWCLPHAVLAVLAVLVPAMPARCGTPAAALGQPAPVLVADAAPPVPVAGINPLTGTPVSLEQVRWALEQSRLEEQLQQSLLNRRKLEAERQRLDGPPWSGPSAVAGPAGMPPGAVLAAPAPGAAMPAAAAPGGPGQTTLPQPVRTRKGVGRRPVVRADPVPTVLGVRQGADGWVLLCVELGELRVVGVGQPFGPSALQAVGPDGYRVGGVFHAVEVGAIHLQGDSSTLPGRRERADPVEGERDPGSLSVANGLAALPSPGDPGPGAGAGALPPFGATVLQRQPLQPLQP